MTARITIPEPVPVPAWSDSEVARLLCYIFPSITTYLHGLNHHSQIPFPLPPPIPSPSLPLSPPYLYSSLSQYEVGESSAAAAARPAGGLRADYGFEDHKDREISE
ncbi:hypothetical protein Tco_1448935 [Tanacetum coccineum]